jgi:sigma-B regulation protein RsbU (phosphoserine phosphatase)
MLVAIWDDTNQTLQIANAGSVQPLFVSMISSGSRTTVDVKTIQAEGFPLGLFSDVEYEEFTLSTRSGDLIVFFSDGIPDAENAAGEMFGTERLAKVLKSMRVPTASSTVQSIVDSVSRFQSGTEHFDDETLVVLRVL